MGGIETAEDAAQFILLGASTVQICTGAMLQGYKMIEHLCEGLSDFMDEHGFASIEEFRGHSLQFFSTHADLVSRQKAAKRAKAGESNRDGMWKGDIAKETDSLAVN